MVDVFFFACLLIHRVCFVRQLKHKQCTSSLQLPNEAYIHRFGYINNDLAWKVGEAYKLWRLLLQHQNITVFHCLQQFNQHWTFFHVCKPQGSYAFISRQMVDFLPDKKQQQEWRIFFLLWPAQQLVFLWWTRVINVLGKDCLGCLFFNFLWWPRSECATKALSI